MKVNSWNPQQYEHFTEERNQPFLDLLDLINPTPHMRIIDLGCGTGKLTHYLHDFLAAQSTCGIDSSKEMLKDNKISEIENFKLIHMNIEDVQTKEEYDLIFSNAALQWVGHHQQLFSKLFHNLSPNGQIAIQIPSNYDYPTHRIANAIASESPFVDVLKGGYKSPVLTIEEYSTLLYILGFQQQIVRQQIYTHLLDSTESLIDWVRGSLLTYYKDRLNNDMYNDFLRIYRKRLLETVGWTSPFLFPMKRILIWAKK